MTTKLLLTAIIATTFAISSYAQNVGIGTASPNVKLDVNGGLSLREGVAFSNTQLTPSGGPFNDVALPSSNSFFRIPSGVSNITGAFTINGFAGGHDGQELIITNQSGYSLTLTNLSVSNTSSTDQISLSNGASTIVVPSGSNVTLTYSKNVANSSSTGAWLVTSVQIPTTSGTVTSVNAGTGLTGGPITTSGTLSLANTAVAAGSYGSSTAVPSYTVNAQGQITSASNVAISASGIGAVTSVTASSPLSSSGGLTPNISLGTVGVSNGGTGNTSLTSDGVLYGNGTGAVGVTAAGTSGEVLTVGALGAPIWSSITATSVGGWALTGNSGTTPGTDFIGTTDANDFVFKADGNEAMRIAESSGNVVIGSGDNTSSPVGGTLRAPNSGGANTDGGSLTITGGLATGNGVGGNVNITAGKGSGTLNGGNVVITSGSHAAGSNGDIDFYLGSSGTADAVIKGTTGDVGIGTTTPTSLLNVNGAETLGTSSSGTTPTTGTLTFDNSSSANSVNISAGNTTTGYSLTLPLAQGAANTVLTNNGSGTLSWVTPSSLNANLTPGTGLTGSAYNGSTAQTFAVNYGSSSGTAVQGNTTLTVSPGTGMSGGGTITLGTGGTVTLNNTGVTSLSVTAPVTNTGTATAPNIGLGTVGVANGGTGLTTITSKGIIYGNGTGAVGVTAAGTSGQILTNTSGTPNWTTATYPSTTTTGQLLYSSGTNTISGLSIGSTGQVLTVSGGVPTWSSITSVLGSGTTNYVTRWTSATTLGTGVIEDNGTTTAIDNAPNGTDLLYINNSAGTATTSALHATTTSGIDFYFGYEPSFTLASGQVCSAGIGAFCNSSAGNALVSSTTEAGGSGIIGNSTSGKGVYGINNVGSQGALAAYPYAAVVGLAENTSSGIGVIGIGNGANANANSDIPAAGSGGAFMGSTRGVFAEYTNTTGGGAGVEGLTANGVDPTFSSTNQDFGVLGMGSTTGTDAAIAGYVGTFATPAAAAGIYGSSSSSTVYAIYANNTSGTGSNGAGLFVSGTSGLAGTTTLGIGSSVNGTLVYDNSSNANTVTIQSGATTTSYTLTLPTAQGAAGTMLTNNGTGTLSWTTAPAGTVTSVGLSMPSIFTVSGSPVTSSGTLTAALASETANTFFAAPNGAAGAPTFRAIVAADIPTLNQNTTGTAANVTGTVAVGNGGTGLTSYTAGSLLDASSTSAVGQIADVTAGSYLRSNGSGSVPVWSTMTLPNAATTGDILYATGTNAIGNLSDVATGDVLISGGVGATPSYGKVALANAVSGTLPTANGGTGLTTVGTNGQVLTVVSGAPAWANATSGGTVTSVGLSMPSIFTVTGSPVTTSGTLTSTLASQTANTVFAAPNGAAGTPTFRALVAADIPTLNQNTTGTSGNVTGTVAVANGGTGLTSAGTNGQVLTIVSGAPAWATPSSSGWALTGNASTTPGTDFVGTTDGNALEFKTDGFEGMRLANGGGSAPGNVVIGSGDGSATVAGGILRAPNITGTNVTGPNLTIESGDGTGTTGTSGNIIFETAPSNGSGSGTTANTMTEAMRITPAGIVAIGTTTPASDATFAVAGGHIEVQQATASTITNGGTTIGSFGSTAASSNLSDEAGMISLTTGSGGGGHAPSTSGTLLTLNFQVAYTTAPVVVLTPTNAAAAAGQSTYSIYVSSSTTGFTINDASTLASGTTYTWNYYVIEPK